ncbi:hypothetical protein [Alsobacter sp. SYSU BS001988]
MSELRHFPPPWSVSRETGGYAVADATGLRLAFVDAGELSIDDGDPKDRLLLDDALWTAGAIAQIPVLMGAIDPPETAWAPVNFQRLPLPWQLLEGAGFFLIRAVNMTSVCWIHYGPERGLDREEAGRVANGVLSLPEMLAGLAAGQTLRAKG